MQNNYYDDTIPMRPYTHSTSATSGTFPPDNAIRGDEAPTAPAGFWPGANADKTGWVNIEDHKGEEGYLNGESYTIKDYGPYPEGWSIEPPAPPEPTEEELMEQRRAALFARFATIDADSVRPMRAIAAGRQTEDDMQRLGELDAEAAALRIELEKLQAVVAESE